MGGGVCVCVYGSSVNIPSANVDVILIVTISILCFLEFAFRFTNISYT